MSLIRGLDSQRRLTIPTETLKSVGADQGDFLRIYGSVTPEGQACVVLEKFEPGCIFCEDPTEDYVELKGKRVCYDCQGLLREEY